MAFFNPFCSQEAISHSNYNTLYKEEILEESEPPKSLKRSTKLAATQVSAYVQENDLSQKKAEEVAKKKPCNFGVYPQLAGKEATAGLCRDLARFVHELNAGESKVQTFMAVFSIPSRLTAEAFQQKVNDQIVLLQKATEPFYCMSESEAKEGNHSGSLLAVGGRVLKVTPIYRNTSQGHLKVDYPMLAFSVQS